MDIRDKKVTKVNSAATSLTLSLPAYQEDDFMVCMAIQNSASGAGAFTIDQGWTKIALTDETPGSDRVGVFWKIATASETPPVIQSSSSPVSNTWMAICSTFSGIDTATSINVTSNVTDNDILQASAPLTTTNNNCIVIHLYAGEQEYYPRPLPGLMDVISENGEDCNMSFGWTVQETAGLVNPAEFYMSYGLFNKTIASIAINDNGSGEVPPYITNPPRMVNPFWGRQNNNFYPQGSFTNNANALIPSVNGYTTVGFPTHQNALGSGIEGGGAIQLIGSSGTLPTEMLSWYTTFSTPEDFTDELVGIHFRSFEVFRPNIEFYMGLMDSSNNYKVWQLAGPTTIPSKDAFQCAVVDPNSSVGVMQSSGTLDVTDVDRVLFFVRDIDSRGGVVITQMQAISKTTEVTLKGGSAVNPGTLADLANGLKSGNCLFMEDQRGQISGQYLSFCPLQLTDFFSVSGTSLSFPDPQNADTRFQTNLADNTLGVTLNGVASKTAVFQDSTILGQQPFYFNISGSSSADWNLGGMQVINSGDITLTDIGPQGGLIFNNCESISAPFNFDFSEGCTFKNFAQHAIVMQSQADLDKLANCHFEGNFIGIRIDIPGSFILQATAITFDSNTYDLEFFQPAFGAWVNDLDSNASTFLNTGGGFVGITDPLSELTITVIDAVTKAPIQGARVYLEADTGGDLAPGTFITNSTTDVNGERFIQQQFTSDQPVIGRVRQSTTPGSLYKNAPISFTMPQAGPSNLTIQMIPDE